MKINVLHIVLSLETGGLENGIVNLLNGADNNSFQVDVLCLRAKGELVKRITNENSQVFFDGNADSSIITAIRKINKVCRSKKYQILHTHGWATMLAGYISHFMTGMPKIINGEHGTIYSQSLKQILIQRFLFRQMDLNLTVSVDLKRKICKKFHQPENRFQPIVNGVNSEKFKPEPAQRNNIRNSLGFQPGDFIVGSVGRFVPVKNYPCLIRAFKDFSEKNLDSRLLLVGDGPDRGALEELIHEYNLGDKVVLTGRRDDMPSVLNALDVFVLASFSEGLSNTILEAMSSGLPVIASNVGGNPEIIINGRTGYLFEVNNDRELSAYFDELYENPEKLKFFADNSRELIESNFSVTTMVGMYEATYLEVVSKAH